MANQNNYRSSTYHIVVEEFDKLNNKHITELDLNNYLKNEMRVAFYSFIKHDSDVDGEGNKERTHYHIVVALNTSYAKSTILNGFANGLSCNVDIVSARKVKSFVKSVQYLIHKNDKDKFQYDYLDIWTNDVNELNMCLYMSASSYEVDIDYLFELVKRSSSLSEIYKELGLQKSKQYRSLIFDMYKEEHIERFL